MTPQDVAITTANSVHDVAITERDIIDGYCTPKYVAANTKVDLQAVDKVCVPARDAYYATRAAWEALVAVLQLAKSGKATDAEVEDAGRKLGLAFADLKTAVGGLR
jgi:3-hydroxyacyl-CoA dehydrogenase